MRYFIVDILFPEILDLLDHAQIHKTRANSAESLDDSLEQTPDYLVSMADQDLVGILSSSAASLDDSEEQTLECRVSVVDQVQVLGNLANSAGPDSHEEQTPDYQLSMVDQF